jgi:hypothetical protein
MKQAGLKIKRTHKFIWNFLFTKYKPIKTRLFKPPSGNVAGFQRLPAGDPAIF